MYILEKLLVLAHPFIPFVTEEIYKNFGKGLCMVAKWPKAKGFDSRVTTDFAELKELVIRLRNLKAENKIPPTEFPDCNIISKVLDEDYLNLAAKLARVNLTNDKVDSEPLYIQSSTVNIDLNKDLSEKEREALEKYVKILETKLSNKKFTDNAPPNVIKDTEKRLEQAKKKLK